MRSLTEPHINGDDLVRFLVAGAGVAAIVLLALAYVMGWD